MAWATWPRRRSSTTIIGSASPSSDGRPSTGEANQAFSRTCTGTPYWTDFMLHNIAATMKTHDFDGFYYDGTIGFRACTNSLHGCGYVDEKGVTRATWPILATRRYSKRLYAICKLHRATNLVDCHTSASVTPMRAAWVDQLWNGEQFENCKPGFHFPMDYFRSQCVGTQYGAPSMFLVYLRRPFELAEAMSFTLLHDVLPRSRDPRVLNLWRIQDRFDVHTAKWLPYWKNAEYLKVVADPPGTLWDEAGMASLYLHHGKASAHRVEQHSGEARQRDRAPLSASHGAEGRRHGATTPRPARRCRSKTARSRSSSTATPTASSGSSSVTEQIRPEPWTRHGSGKRSGERPPRKNS